MPRWEVVGGADKGGLLVREAEAISSRKLPERLSTGAVVQELDLINERLRYRLLEGSGPLQGWVSIRLGNRELLVRRGTGARAPAQRAREEVPQWRGPPSWDSFRFGDFLWAGRAGLVQAPPCDFFPREWYGALILPRRRPGGCSSVLLLGGCLDDATCMNDVWQLELPNLAIMQEPQLGSWTLLSPHDGGTSDGNGRRLLRKWRPRRDFACCLAPSAGGDGGLLYVAGGSSVGGTLGDFWASQDDGQSWVCMSQAAPWGHRRAAALHAVPGRPERLLLAGGMGMYAEVCLDAWSSDDAGSTWTRLERPAWSDVTGRYRSAFLPLPSPKGREDREARALLLGGCFVDGGEGGGQGLVGLERLMHDAWECRWDLTSVHEERAVTWVRWGWGSEERGPSMAMVGVESASAALEASTGTLIARLPDRDFVSVGAACDPEAWVRAGRAKQTEETMNIQWQQVELHRQVELVKGMRRSHDPVKAGKQMVYVRMAAGDAFAASRLVLSRREGILLSGAGEFFQQFRLLALLGARLERKRGLPSSLWRGRVLPFVMPALEQR